MKVLLISPLPRLDPPCGDVTYTQTLLSHPPAGVEYETYAQAIDRGTLREHGSGRAIRTAKIEGGPVAREIGLAVMAKSMNWMRRRHWLFWEPFRFFSVRPGEYDLIHLHVFSARFQDLPCPLVVSNACPVRYLYTEARGYRERRVNLMEAVDGVLGRGLGMNVNSYHLPQASRVIAFTHYLRDWYAGRGIADARRIDVVPIFLPTADTAPESDLPHRVGFIAKDFDAKGGRTLLEAFEIVRRVRPDAQLTVVGSPRRTASSHVAHQGIRWIPYVERQTLLREIMPSFDVMAYPTQFDGMPLVVLEAMSMGIPVATSNYQAMPELVDHGRAGLVSPVKDPAALATNILHALEPSANRRYRRASVERFRRSFSADAVRPKLKTSYEMAASRDNDSFAAA